MELWSALGAAEVPPRLEANAAELRARYQEIWPTVSADGWRALERGLRETDDIGHILRLVQSTTGELYEIALAIRALAIQSALMTTGGLPGVSPDVLSAILSDIRSGKMADKMADKMAMLFDGSSVGSSVESPGLPGEELVYEEGFDHTWYERVLKEMPC